MKFCNLGDKTFETELSENDKNVPLIVCDFHTK